MPGSSVRLPSLSPVGGGKRSIPELEDHCRPFGTVSYAEHDYPPATAESRCRRCGAAEREDRS
ncbi:hypothetical protein GCM10010245_86830 [Streptomyces spectabilis]|uniref:Uncharacterized protein n=1 Tax=Streptomyces spectabilis TaxID=68270 RepID=A0A7W8B3F1_STRST|nr:hypothetical protein [Streptomyces spectabilis]GGV54889.1 hypothetical protein GCM10010245_86830 [Streptomyces spectabilis]